MREPTTSPQTDERVIRVFVSSTFRDMQAERDELVLKIFPQLRKLCESRGVTWGEVDLRWGISDEQAAEGQVLPICLEEIRRCRPYFIGLLGERYGWIPETIPAEVVEREPWLREHVHGRKSVTELEILHGVLNNSKMAGHSLFYFREPNYVDRIDVDERRHFIEQDPDARERLVSLKQRIRNSGGASKENYPDPETLGQWVLADLTRVIDQQFPTGSEVDALARERLDHEAFARSRAGVYIGREAYFVRLDAHASGDGPPLVVLGESGGGKSALLSNWALRYRERHPHEFLLLHFIGGSPDSANATGILRRIMLELKRRFELPDDVPVQPEKIREAFPNWLVQVAGRGRVVLVLDALNQLEDVDNAPDLGWLPRVFPKNCRVILSTLPGRSLDAMTQRGWLESTRPFKVEPLDEAERRRLIGEFLAQYTRNIGPTRTDRLVRAPPTANPLYLRVLLDELRVFGVHEKLNERIDWYLEAENPYELYRKVIARWEDAYAGGTGLVRDVLTLFSAARRGLSEAELLEALGQNGRPLPHAVWSPLFLAMSDALVSRSGLLTFAHDFLRTSARDVYLPDESRQQAAHRRLAEYFQQQPTWSDRKLDELPWQLAAAGQWQELHDALTVQPCFLGLRRRSEYELLGYWLKLGPPFELAASYTAAFARWSHGQPDTPELAVVANDLATFLHTAACHAAAEPLFRRALAIDEQSFGDLHPYVAVALNNLGHLLQATNRLTEAEPLMRRALAIGEQSLGDRHSDVAAHLGNLALLLLRTNRLAQAEPLMRRALAIEEQSFGDQHPRVAKSLNNLAQFLLATNRLAEAEQLVRRALAIDEQSFGEQHPDVAGVLNNLAQLLKETNRLAEAEPLMRRALAVDEQSFGDQHPRVATSLNNLADLLQAANRPAEAEPLIRRALAIDEQSYGDQHPEVALKLNNLAVLLQATNRRADAELLMRRALSIWEQSLGADHPRVAVQLYNLAQLLQATNRRAEAEPLLRRAVDILSEFKRTTRHEHPGMQTIQRNYKGLRTARAVEKLAAIGLLVAVPGVCTVGVVYAFGFTWVTLILIVLPVAYLSLLGLGAIRILLRNHNHA